MTVGQLLQSSSGLPDRGVPSNRALGKRLDLGRVATFDEAIAYLWRLDTLFRPGTDREFSHWSYQLLGRVIEKISGMSYADYLHRHTGLPLGLTTVHQSLSGPGNTLANESWYAGQFFRFREWDFDNALGLVPEPYAIDMAARPGAGSLAVSAPDFVRLIRTTRGSGGGSLSGTLSFAIEFRLTDGSNVWMVIIANERIDGVGHIIDDLAKDLANDLKTRSSLPRIDLYDRMLDITNATASGDDGNGPANAVDGDFHTRWSARGDGQWIELDLGEDKIVRKLALAAFKGNLRAANFDVQIRAEHETPFTTLTTDAPIQTSGLTLDMETYALPARAGRYVRLIGHGNSSNLWNSYTEIKILGSETGPQHVYQAEDARLAGGSKVDANHSGFFGTGFVNASINGGSIEWIGVDGGPGDNTSLDIRYALAAPPSRRAELIINGVTRTITFTSTGAWNKWETLNEIVALNPGRVNTIQLLTTGEDAGNIDDIHIGLQSEVTHLSGGSVVENNHGGYDGTGFVNSPRNGGRIEWFNLDGRHGGDATIRLRYALGAPTARRASVVVNGKHYPVTFQSTGTWTDWQTVDVPVELVSGRRNAIRVETTGQDAGNIDTLTIVH